MGTDKAEKGWEPSLPAVPVAGADLSLQESQWPYNGQIRES
jgi:hypothetical protein